MTNSQHLKYCKHSNTIISQKLQLLHTQYYNKNPYVWNFGKHNLTITPLSMPRSMSTTGRTGDLTQERFWQPCTAWSGTKTKKKCWCVIYWRKWPSCIIDLSFKDKEHFAFAKQNLKKIEWHANKVLPPSLPLSLSFSLSLSAKTKFQEAEKVLALTTTSQTKEDFKLWTTALIYLCNDLKTQQMNISTMTSNWSIHRTSLVHYNNKQQPLCLWVSPNSICPYIITTSNPNQMSLGQSQFCLSLYHYNK